MDKKAFSVHAHFYQPPREDPLNGTIPDEPGAAPYRNWNERIHAECYRPNAELGNYARISYNVGPTLFGWMEAYDPSTTSAIVAQDRSNVLRNGVGNAMAQPFNHTILPLSPRRDKRTQVAWGIADFRHRFGRMPQGMWLPETAADLETLDVLAEAGIEFTILAPWQADATHLDTGQAYRVKLPGGKQIAVFFYHQDLSTRLSFDPGITTDADAFVRDNLLPRFNGHGGSRIVLVASDGELYGHHQPFRDKFLAHLVDGASHARDVATTYPALWLREHPARKTIAIREKTSWSCHHGVARWSEECGCTPGATWKAPLRRALEEIAADVDRIYAETLAPWFTDPWVLRDEYIAVMLGEVTPREFIRERAGAGLEDEGVRQIQMLLKAQYERQRAFTSCGWFFDDFDRIEPRNNVAYAAQAVWLTRQATGVDLEPEALRRLHGVMSARSGLRADTVFSRHLQRARFTLTKDLYQG